MKPGNVLIEKTDEELTVIQSEVLRLGSAQTRTMNSDCTADPSGGDPGIPLGSHTPPGRRRHPLPNTRKAFRVEVVQQRALQSVNHRSHRDLSLSFLV
jgi:hypothetical protein